MADLPINLAVQSVNDLLQRSRGALAIHVPLSAPVRHPVNRKMMLCVLLPMFVVVWWAFFAAPPSRAQKYPILPVPDSPHGIFTMMQDSHSRLWLGTIDDVQCYDGAHFFSLRGYGFPKEVPNAFAEDSDGGIWIA